MSFLNNSEDTGGEVGESVKSLGLYFISFGINASCLSNMK